MPCGPQAHRECVGPGNPACSQSHKKLTHEPHLGEKNTNSPGEEQLGGKRKRSEGLVCLGVRAEWREAKPGGHLWLKFKQGMIQFFSKM